MIFVCSPPECGNPASILCVTEVIPSYRHGRPLSVVRRGGQGWRFSATKGLSLTAASAAEPWGEHRGPGVLGPASEFWQHAGQDLEAKILLIAQAVRASLDDADFVIQPLDEPQGHLVFRPAVSSNAVPMTIDHLGKLLIALQSLPFETCPPVLKELPRPSFVVVIPKLSICRARHMDSWTKPLRGSSRG